MWQPIVETLQGGRVRRITITRGSSPVSYAQVIEGWKSDGGFREFYLSLLADAPFGAMFWEAPPVTRVTLGRAYEFVMVDAPALSEVSADAFAFASAFDAATSNESVATFPNLGRDALLVAPCPGGPAHVYPHLAAFVRGAPEAQKHDLFISLAKAIEQHIGDEPLWVSTSGMGVYWLHIRLDSQPKYYIFQPYTRSF